VPPIIDFAFNFRFGVSIILEKHRDSNANFYQEVRREAQSNRAGAA
jgi:hypothetical protein